ncbi:MAG: DUF1080 domain-containing protein [Fuerstiella sp.]|jgi:hypothetical protein|nr:DUF1080 domain-containing protein [Fuerstiella sp.]
MKQFRIAASLIACVLLGPAIPVGEAGTPCRPANDSQWHKLFDGQSLAGWRGYQQTEAPRSGWSVTDGTLFSDGSSRTDLITTKMYSDYELVVEWRTEADGNSGILIHADESTKKIAFNAPEIQIYATGQRNPGIGHQAGALYALYPAIESSVKPPMAWNTTRVLCVGKRIAIWHNDAQVCDTVVGNEEWNRKISHSKFSDSQTFGKRTSGYIGLQDHGKKVWFRTVKLRSMARK